MTLWFWRKKTRGFCESTRVFASEIDAAPGPGSRASSGGEPCGDGRVQRGGRERAEGAGVLPPPVLVEANGCVLEEGDLCLNHPKKDNSTTTRGGSVLEHTHTHTHSEIGFELTQFPGRKW